MNVSLMDSYNLAWKIAYHLLSLNPPHPHPNLNPKPSPDTDQSPQSISILRTYATARSQVASDLIEFDKQFSGMFSGKVGASYGDEGAEPLTHERFLEVFSAASGFSSGCGLEYQSSYAIIPASIGTERPTQDELLQGALWPGRRLINVSVVRHADGVPRALQDGI